MKIKGLSSFHRIALKQKLAQANIFNDLEISFEDSISLLRLSSLWYGGGMVNIKYKGYTFHVEAIGDVYANLYSVGSERHLCYVKDKNNNGNFGSEMFSYFRSDKILEDALSVQPRIYRLEMQHNNWWECFVTDNSGVFHDLMWALDEDNLFKAIIEAINGFDDTIRYLEEEKTA